MLTRAALRYALSISARSARAGRPSQAFSKRALLTLLRRFLPSAAEEGNALLGDWLCRLPGRGQTAGFVEALVKPVEDFIISGGDFEFDAPSATTRVLSEEKAAEVPRARPTAFPV